ncbi:MAG TPA: hypothetical protein EYQ57_09790 [Methylococcaceae bacterium]|nr:hypothetical protein [Methylococcaceae bacterium]
MRIGCYPDFIATLKQNLDSLLKAVKDLLAGKNGGSYPVTFHEMNTMSVEFADGWRLLRASNIVAVLTLRFEADNPAALQRIQQ